MAQPARRRFPLSPAIRTAPDRTRMAVSDPDRQRPLRASASDGAKMEWARALLQRDEGSARGRDRDQHEVLGCVDYWLEFLTVTYSRGSNRPMADWAQASLTATEPKRILGQIRYTSEIKNVNTTRQAGSRLPSGSASDPARRVPVLRADARCAFRCACPRCAVCRFCAALTTGPGSEPSRRDSLQAFQVARARPRWFCQ